MFENVSALPICVDLDGTLSFDDNVETIRRKFFIENNFAFLKSLLWLARGIGFAKTMMASKIDFDPSTVHYNENLIEWLLKQKTSIYLVTGTPTIVAEKISTFLSKQYKINFMKTIGAEKNNRLIGKSKAKYLIDQFGSNNFIYIGNSYQDRYIWEHSYKILAVNPNFLTKIWIKNCQKKHEIIYAGQEL